MFNSSAAIYAGLKQSRARCVEARTAQSERHQFFVGTLNRRDKNEVHLIDFDEIANNILLKGIFSHQDEVWKLASCPFDPDLLCSVTQASAGGFRASLHRLPAADQFDGSAELSDVLTLPVEDGLRIHDIVWNPNASEDSLGNSIATVDDAGLSVWSLKPDGDAVELARAGDDVKFARVGEGAFEPKRRGMLAPPAVSVCWDPHHPKQLVTAANTVLTNWDLRSNKAKRTVSDAHTDTIRDVDYNPNRPYFVVTGSDDSTIRFWDLRKSSEPVKVVGGMEQAHSHWVSQVKYNRFHDQLLLSSGTDGQVMLWNLITISSAPLGDLEDAANELEGDRVIKTYDEHEESVYSVSWSCCDAWVFASLSYDGRLVVNHVPPAEKYKILL